MCSSYLLLPDPICLYSCEDICEVKSPRLRLEHMLLFSLNSSFHSVRRCLSSGCPIKAAGCESQFRTSLRCFFTHLHTMLAFSCAFFPGIAQTGSSLITLVTASYNVHHSVLHIAAVFHVQMLVLPNDLFWPATLQ